MVSSTDSRRSVRLRVGLFGHFGAGNVGNESTLEAIVFQIRRGLVGAEISCICTWPSVVTEEYDIETIPVSTVVVGAWKARNPLSKFVRRIVIGVPSELYRWFDGVRTLRNIDALVIVGTGLLTDAFCLGGWGPYSTFKWAAMAKLSGCKLFFVSVGAGPLHRTIGRFLVRCALALGDFRSYRDGATQTYLESIGFRRGQDRVFPDLAFSLPSNVQPVRRPRKSSRPVVGLGLMTHSGMYGIRETTRADYVNYQETLATFAKWLLGRGYDVRLLIGDLMDRPAVEDFKSLLSHQLTSSEQERVGAQRIDSSKDLFEQLAQTDFVVGTRFHNVLLALLFNKPSIAIAFHHKCSALMDEMGLSEYCVDIKKLNPGELIEQFCRLEANAAALKQKIGERVAECSKALDEQYRIIFKELLPN